MEKEGTKKQAANDNVRKLNTFEYGETSERRSAKKNKSEHQDALEAEENIEEDGTEGNNTNLGGAVGPEPPLPP